MRKTIKIKIKNIKIKIKIKNPLTAPLDAPEHSTSRALGFPLCTNSGTTASWGCATPHRHQNATAQNHSQHGHRAQGADRKTPPPQGNRRSCAHAASKGGSQTIPGTAWTKGCPRGLPVLLAQPTPKPRSGGARGWWGAPHSPQLSPLKLRTACTAGQLRDGDFGQVPACSPAGISESFPGSCTRFSAGPPPDNKQKFLRSLLSSGARFLEQFRRISLKPLCAAPWLFNSHTAQQAGWLLASAQEDR